MRGNGRNETGDGNQQNDKQPKNAIVKKAAGNQAGVLWESTNLVSALTHSIHQLHSLSHPHDTPASKKVRSKGQNLPMQRQLPT